MKDTVTAQELKGNGNCIAMLRTDADKLGVLNLKLETGPGSLILIPLQAFFNAQMNLNRNPAELYETDGF